MSDTALHDLPKIDYSLLPMTADRATGWAVLRDAGPVLVDDDGWYYLTRREDVLHALRSPQHFSSQRSFDGMISPVPLVPLAFDPPEHTRFRRMLHHFFSPQTLSGLLPSLQNQAREMVADIADRTECEVMADLATPYPSQVFLTILGLPLADRERLIRWKDAILEVSLATDPETVDLTAAAEMFAYLTEAVADQRKNPRDGVLSKILHSPEPFTDAEATGLALVLVLAGLDTVTSAIGAAMLELARRPDLRRTLRGDAKQIGVFVEEMLRLEPPAPIVGRVTTQSVTVAGITLPPDTPVRLCIGAINRDGSDERSGDDLVMDGKLHTHWGFGGGAHRCLGAHLARMELNVVVAEWLEAVSEFRLAPGFRPLIKWPSATFALPRLPLRIGD